MPNKAGRYSKRLILVSLCLLAGACVTITGNRMLSHDRGVRFPHDKHAEEGIECTDCHDLTDKTAIMPTHDLCSLCHEIDMDNPDMKDCGQCHTNEEFEITPREATFTEESEVRFEHAPHTEKAELECAVCHVDPDKGVLPSGPLKPFCMDCHEKTNPDLAECSVCHRSITKEVRPTHRKGTRIAHDAPEIWKKVHGREARVDRAYCNLCHEEQENFCTDCHRTTPPESHTLSWRRKQHGLRASWDRNKCAVCHEEDSCLRCHQNTRPRSHRSAWGEPANRHCTSCHYPPDRSGCTTCHLSIEHKDATRSPHRTRLFTTPCSMCHPAGMPGRPPHFENSTVRCLNCH